MMLMAVSGKQVGEFRSNILIAYTTGGCLGEEYEGGRQRRREGPERREYAALDAMTRNR